MNERLRVLIADILDLRPADIAPDMVRESTAEWNSLNHLRLMTALEEEFGISLTMDEIIAIHTPWELQTIGALRGPEWSLMRVLFLAKGSFPAVVITGWFHLQPIPTLPQRSGSRRACRRSLPRIVPIERVR
jgi:acyl carrier protein